MIPEQIRQAQPDDIDDIMIIWRDSVLASHSFFSEEDMNTFTPGFREYVQKQYAHIWVWEAETILGFIGIEDAMILTLFIRPSHFRQGIGRKLIHFGMNHCAATRVSVYESNTRAVLFYQQLGFVVASRTEQDGDGRELPMLEMVLLAQKP